MNIHSDKLVKIEPGKIVILSEKMYRESWKTRYYDKQIRKWENRNSLVNLTKEKTSWRTSETTRREIKRSILSLFYLSKARTVQITSQKFIYNFKASFVTLTLPSKQMHTDVEIKKLLNLFFNNLRNLGVQNYVWKAELQKNENIHFHIVLDKYFSFFHIRHLWNKQLGSLGYIENYQKEWSGLTFSEYAEKRGIEKEKAVSGYQHGQKNDWQQPNTVDVRAVRTANELSGYLSKYLSKEISENEDEERAKVFGKIWSRSQSLSRLKYKNYLDTDYIKKLEQILAGCKKGIKKVYYQYCTVVYYQIKNVTAEMKALINRAIRGNALMYSYPFPG